MRARLLPLLVLVGCSSGSSSGKQPQVTPLQPGPGCIITEEVSGVEDTATCRTGGGNVVCGCSQSPGGGGVIFESITDEAICAQDHAQAAIDACHP